jgi:hypothetical protein
MLLKPALVIFKSCGLLTHVLLCPQVLLPEVFLGPHPLLSCPSLDQGPACSYIICPSEVPWDEFLSAAPSSFQSLNDGVTYDQISLSLHGYIFVGSLFFYQANGLQLHLVVRDMKSYLLGMAFLPCLTPNYLQNLHSNLASLQETPLPIPVLLCFCFLKTDLVQSPTLHHSATPVSLLLGRSSLASVMLTPRPLIPSPNSI